MISHPAQTHITIYSTSQITKIQAASLQIFTPHKTSNFYNISRLDQQYSSEAYKFQTGTT